VTIFWMPRIAVHVCVPKVRAKRCDRSYSAVRRLVGARQGGVEQRYQYDAVGNRVKRVANGNATTRLTILRPGLGGGRYAAPEAQDKLRQRWQDT